MNDQQEAVYTLLSFLSKLPLWGWLILAVVAAAMLALVLTGVIK